MKRRMKDHLQLLCPLRSTLSNISCEQHVVIAEGLLQGVQSEIQVKRGNGMDGCHTHEQELQCRVEFADSGRVDFGRWNRKVPVASECFLQQSYCS